MNRRYLQKWASIALACATAGFLMQASLARAPKYPTPLVEVYVGGETVGRNKHSRGHIGTVAKGVFRHSDGSFSTHGVALDTAYRWEQGDRAMQFMLPLPSEEQKCLDFVGAMLVSAVVAAMLAIAGFCTLPEKRVDGW